jgi:hypothetical protein
MPEKYLLSTAYFPPISYLSLIHRAKKVYIETEENYIKQTYRNRCLILTANGPLPLIIPVMTGRTEKTRIRDLQIDYSKRWQQIHLRALISSYRSSAFFEYYFEDIAKLISGTPEFLLELNINSLETILKIMKIPTDIEYTKAFEPVIGNDYDFRYLISPKKDKPDKSSLKEYYQVFSNKFGFVPGLSILDLLFNAGPDSVKYL